MEPYVHSLTPGIEIQCGSKASEVAPGINSSPRVDVRADDQSDHLPSTGSAALPLAATSDQHRLEFSLALHLYLVVRSDRTLVGVPVVLTTPKHSFSLLVTLEFFDVSVISFPTCAPISLVVCVFGPTLDEDIQYCRSMGECCWGLCLYVDWVLYGACVSWVI